MKNHSFYKTFEDKFRGDQETIKSRIEVYLPFILPLCKIYPHPKAIDLGCGRGEWLDMMKKHSIDCIGIDTNESMLEECRKKDLNTLNTDACNYLEKIETESQLVISAIHIAEHINFEALTSIIKEALRVLKPGGLLIIETPNPENLLVATNNFYIDPTHRNPIPQELLSFIPEYLGFERVKILRLQENPSLKQSEKVNLLDVYSGASLDIAIVAQKNASEEILNVVSDKFNVEFGLSTIHLAQKYDSYIEKQFELLRNEIKLIKDKADNINELYQSVIQSNSWWITKPLRFTIKQFKKFINVIKIYKLLLKKNLLRKYKY